MTMPKDVTPSDFMRLEEKNVELLLTRADELALVRHERGEQLSLEVRAQTEQLNKLVATELHARVDALTGDMRAIDMRAQVQHLTDELKTNSEATKRVEENTKGLVEAFEAVQGGMKVLDWLGMVGTKLLWITVPLAMLYGGWQAFELWLTSGRGPPKP